MSARKRVGSKERLWKHRRKRQRTPLIPAAGPLAETKSLKQKGLPVEATHAAVPADNPQTPAKIPLGEKLFFNGRLSADGTETCSTRHQPRHAVTAGRPEWGRT